MWIEIWLVPEVRERRRSCRGGICARRLRLRLGERDLRASLMCTWCVRRRESEYVSEV